MQTPPTPKEQSTLALVAVILAVICAPVGLVLGIIALIRIQNARGELGGRGLALAAIVIPLLMVPVLGILTAIAIPNFIKYQLRSKTAEAKIQLGSIRVAQEARRAEVDQYVSFAPNPSAPPTSTKVAFEDRPCPQSCKDGVAIACMEADCLGLRGLGQVYYRYACETRPVGDGAPPEFTCVAVGDLDGDGELAAFIYGTANREGATTIQAPIPAIARDLCTGAISPNQVVDCTPGKF